MDEKKNGYKKTAIGWIPEEWEVEVVDRLSQKIGSGSTPKGGSNVYKTSGIKFIRSQNVYPDGLRLENLVYISEDQHAGMKNTQLRIYDVLLNITGASIGRCYYVPENFGEGNINQHVCIIRCNNLLYPVFLTYFLNSSLGQKQIESLQAGLSREGLNFAQVKQIKVFLPPLPEQHKIAEILGVWDRAIFLTEKLIQAKENLKKGLMQQLLSGNVRFSEFVGENREEIKLSSFLMLSLRPVKKPEKNYLSLGIRSHGKGTFLKEDSEPEKIELTTLYQVKKGDLIVNITFAWEGAITIAKDCDEGALVSHRFPTYEFNRETVIPEYFRYVILQKNFVYKLGLISPGGAGRNRVLNKNSFLKLVITIPPLPEQRKIASVLTACDREIGLLRQELASLKTQKKGLMQQLLTGKTRVKVEK